MKIENDNPPQPALDRDDAGSIPPASTNLNSNLHATGSKPVANSGKVTPLELTPPDPLNPHDPLNLRWYLLDIPWCRPEHVGTVILAGSPDPHAGQCIANIDLDDPDDSATALRTLRYIVNLHNSQTIGDRPAEIDRDQLSIDFDTLDYL